MILAELDVENIIFTVTTMAAGVGAAIGAMVHREKQKSSKQGDEFDQKLCDEKHKNIDQKLTSICNHQESIGTKLDRLIERLLR
jgi:hypothetical protein